MGVLLNAANAPELIEARATIDQLSRLGEHGWLESRRAERLIAVFNEAALLRDRLFLERDCRDSLPEESRQVVAETWQALFGDA